MNLSIPLPVVAALLGAGALIYMGHRWLAALNASIDSARRTNEEVVKGAEKTLAALLAAQVAVDKLREALAPSAEAMRANMEGVPKLLEGVTRIGQAQLDIMQAQRAEQQRQKENPFGRPNAPMSSRDTAAANLEHEVMQSMRAEGISREEALLRMNGANSQSVWEGNGPLEGWR